MRAAGFEPEDYETDPVDVWPENWPAWDLFCMVSTQWRTGGTGGMGGMVCYVGLDYGPLFVVMDRRGIKDDDWISVFSDIRVIEAEALDTIRGQQE